MAAESDLCTMDWNARILFKDMYFVIVEKPFLMLSQADKKGEKGVNELLYEHLGKPNYWHLLQRVDRVAGGVMTITLSKRVALAMQQQQVDRSIEKTYLVVTEQTPDVPKARLEHYMKRVGGSQRFRVFAEKVPGAKSAILEYKVLQTREKRSLVEVKLITGRTHQIRAQLSSIGCTVVGDKKYGKTRWLDDHSICLFSKSVSFQHPLTGKKVTATAKYPTEREVWKDFEYQEE